MNANSFEKVIFVAIMLYRSDNVKFLTKLSFNYRWSHILFFVLSLTLSIIIVLQSVQIGIVIDAILYKHTIDYPFVLSSIIIILFGRSVFQTMLKLTGNKLSYNVKHDLRKRISKESKEVGSVMNLVQQGIEGVHGFYGDYLPQAYRSIFIPLSILIFLAFFHYKTALIMLITAPFIPIFYIIIGINTEKQALKQMLSLNQFSNYFLNVMKGILTIKAFNYENEALSKVASYSEQFKTHTMKILKTAFLSTLMLEFISMLSIGIIALEIGLSLIVFKSVSFYTAVVVLMLAPEFYNALKDLGLAFHTGKTAAGYGDMLSEALTGQEQNIIYDNQSEISFHNVKVTYETGDFMMNIHEMTIPLGHYTITGHSGAGKSTFAKVLSGLTHFEGQIHMHSPLKDNIVYLSQFDAILSDSVINNITMFNAYNFDEVVALAKQFKMHDRIMAMPNGYDTILGPEGEQLSGGEMRRISLMRVFLFPKRLVILDEPTTMLDRESRKIIMDAVETLKQNCYVMIIAHNKETIENSKNLITVNDGSITIKRHSELGVK